MRKVNSVLAAVVLVLAGNTVFAASGQFSEALKIKHAGDREKACRMFSACSQGNDLDCQAEFAVCQTIGKGTPKDMEGGLRLLKGLAEKGNARAQLNLGKFYRLVGVNGKPDLNLALSWLTKAANQNEAEAQESLGDMYEQGEGVKKNISEATKWYEKAANNGDTFSQNRLGNIFYQKKAFKESFNWYLKAANQGHADSMVSVGNMHKEGEGTAKDLAKAAEWFRKAAELDNAEGQTNLAVMLASGEGVKKDEKQAVELWKKAAEKGDRFAQYSLAWRYEEGSTVKKDKAEALRWYRKAADQGMQEAKDALKRIK